MAEGGAVAAVAGEPILRFDRVSKSYAGQAVLRELDLEIGQGEFLTLLGPSGCGKTTSLNLIAGLLEPDAGVITLRGRRANGLPPQKRGLGLVFQSWALFPHMTAFDNVAYGLRIRKVRGSEIERRVREMLALVRLDAAAERYPSQLSGGMQQRVALARAVVTRPELLLLDEPLSNLDAALRKEMQVEIRRIHKELGISTLLVTHSQEEALVMSDRIAVMRAGRIECIGTPDAVYNRPPNRFVCTFLGDANVLEGQVEGEALVCGGLRVGLPEMAGLVSGQSLTVAIRPEQVVLGAGPIEAVVRDTVFRGSNIAYALDAAGMALQALSLPRWGTRPHRVGDVVRLALPPGALMPLGDVAHA